jgi:hypothetical protein
VAVILAGFTLVLIVSLAAMWRWSTAQEVSAVAGAITGLVGTVVGAFFGVQVGSAGAEQAERARQEAEHARARAEMRALRLAGSSDPARAESVLVADSLDPLPRI